MSHLVKARSGEKQTFGRGTYVLILKMSAMRRDSYRDLRS
jgi:hypothetical protein